MSWAGALLDRLPVTAVAMTLLFILVFFATDGSTSQGTALVFIGVLYLLLPVVQAMKFGDDSDLLAAGFMIVVAFAVIAGLDVLIAHILRKRTSARARWVIRGVVLVAFAVFLLATPPAGPLIKMF